jgi:prepilin-type N-terminal cleavage/methylation domain-containing protein
MPRKRRVGYPNAISQPIKRATACSTALLASPLPGKAAWITTPGRTSLTCGFQHGFRHENLRIANGLGERQRRAFTLIELLVVIAILGIMAALLLPSLSKAKNKAIQTVDINNLKQIITAVQLYATDSRDVLPAPNWLMQDISGYAGWLYTLNLTSGGSSPFSLEKGLLWPALKNPKLYMCPMDNTNSSLFRQRDQQLSSYAMNGAIIGYYLTNYPAEKLGRMRPDDIAFWETDEKEPTYFNDGANLPAEGVSARHLNGAIQAAFGGSVSYIRMGAWYVQVYDTNRNNLWCYPGSPDGR